ncbi:MAG: protein translocase subunit SecD [Actinobacteria bacterium]|nr:MAG: protein translocase subunit SecD [Actinomycetota bacterium]
MRRHLWILLAVAAALIGVGVLAVFRSPTLGLDLQGGLEVVLEAKAPPGHSITQDDINRSIEIMRSRIDKLGVSEPEIRQQGKTQIAVELPGVHDAARAAQIIGQTAQLQFYDLQGDLVPPSIDAQGFPVAGRRLLPLLVPASEGLKKGLPTAWYAFSKSKSLLAGPANTKQDLVRQLPGGTAPKGVQFYVVPRGRIVLTCGSSATACPGARGTPSRTNYYLFKYQPDNPTHPIPELTGKDLKLNGTRQDFGQNNEPIVTLQFTNSGGNKFHDVTRQLAQRGQLRSQNGQTDFQSFAIVLDGEIRSFPYIDFRTNPDGIPGGQAQIQGIGSIGEAKDLALVLQTGALPVQFVQVERTDISATLGSDSLHQALVAAVAGLAVVALFLLLFYRFLGLVAVLGLGIYGALLYGAILLFHVTLSLPGFAGLILTIGVAADANVVIFERIKEEVRAGKSVRAAVATGYRKGFSTIVDANVVTMITAAVLFVFTTAGVKGFALMLLIGTLISMGTAVAATRALLATLSGFRWFHNPAFMGATAKRIPAWQKVDFIGRRRFWFALSGAVLAIGIGSLAIQGLNLGIDFKGGSQITFRTPKPVSVDRVRAEAARIGQADAVIQGRGSQVNGGYSSFQIRTRSLSAPGQTTLEQALTRDVGATSIGVKNVSASFSSQILQKAIYAIIASLFLFVLYIAIRFQFKFAVPVLIALCHDILITLGIYSVTGREMTNATVAALLTILGYSIYDTIIIFDRVRENIPLMRRSSFTAIANQSLWETIRRSLATTFITLLPVTSLLVFGGDTLKDFAFALLVGICSGAYSTIFIAAPLLTIMKEREPEYARRRDAGLQEKLEEEEPAAEVTQAPPEAAPAPVAAFEPEPVEPEPALTAGDGTAARREARRKRRRARPHGRTR